MPLTRTHHFGFDARRQSCLGVKLAYTRQRCDLTWVLSGFDKNGGGYMTIFRMIKNLEVLGGFDQQVLIIGDDAKNKVTDAVSFVRSSIFPIKARIYAAPGPIPRTRAFMATSWPTAYFVNEQPSKLKKFYFVQDFEPLFYPAGSTAALAENTYRFGFKAITAGRWLSEKLVHDYQSEAVPFGFSYDRHIHLPPTTRASIDFEYDIFFYARPATSRRMFELGVAAICHALQAIGRPVRIVFAGGHLPPNCAPFSYTSLGVLAFDQLAKLYGRVRCALVLSATNASLLPYEIMACGCPVVTNQGPHNEWLFPEGYGGVSPSTPDSLGCRLAEILTEPMLREQLSADGLRIVAGTDWLDSARIVHRFLQKEDVVKDSPVNSGKKF